jgi:penicillin amidase
VVILFAALAWLLLRASLPAIDGSLDVVGLSGPVSVARDDMGIPTITAGDRRDLAFGTGFVHAQDRFFQMDLTRRTAAGELAEVFGPAALPLDKRNRFHRFRSRAKSVLDGLSATETDVLSAYAEGVNAGLAALGARPFEYLLLGAVPGPWKSEDSILVGYAMFMELNDERATRDVRRGLVQQVLPWSVFEWLYPQGTEWDAPLLGEPRENLPIPDPGEFTVTRSGLRLEHDAETDIPGSNNWAISGALTATGRAIVANDMHLGITVPTVFYRARLTVAGADGPDLNGLTLPGVPVLVAGSNGRIAWGNTNSYGDWSDAVIIRQGTAAESYLTPQGESRFDIVREQIQIKGEEPYELLIRETRWGPLLDDDDDPDRLLAVSWIAHHPEAINIAQLRLETASSAAEALHIANSIGMPPQNFVVGDADGNIGWTIAGKIPRRTDYDPFLPADWSEGGGWNGWLDGAQYPRILNPDSGRIWTANGRVVDGEALQLIGDGGYDLGALAAQIRAGLLGRNLFAPEHSLQLQLDDRAVFLSRWQDLLLQTLPDEAVAGHALRAEYRALVADWIPRASIDSVGYRLVRGFRLEVRNRVFDMLVQAVVEHYGEDVQLRISNQFEGPLWFLLRERPRHMLAAEYSSWDELLLAAVDANIDYLRKNFQGGLAMRSWGERNTASIRHPVSRSIPFLSGWLDMPAEPLPGDANLPRAQGPSFGAAERFAVSPGDERNGYLHMPAGQSGHPLSNFYTRGHDDWVQGRFSAFLPGAARHNLILNPAQ